MGLKSASTTRVVVWLGRSRRVHHLVGLLRIYLAAELFLRRFPLQRRLPGGLRYRLTSPDEFSTEYELFQQQSYLPALRGRSVETFIDLGCNAGWFALWLSLVQPNPRRLGLLIDAHPRMVAEAEWHVRENGLGNLTVVHGAVGLPRGKTTAAFNLHPSSSGSSLLPFQSKAQLPVKGRITTVTVPAISVADAWSRAFGNMSVDLLKVDIEGTELDLFAYEAAFLRQSVRRIVVEWHKWCVSLDALDACLEPTGFVRQGVFDDRELAGLAIYDGPLGVV
jgi:FkbM family methyltransferase